MKLSSAVSLALLLVPALAAPVAEPLAASGGALEPRPANSLAIRTPVGGKGGNGNHGNGGKGKGKGKQNLSDDEDLKETAKEILGAKSDKVLKEYSTEKRERSLKTLKKLTETAPEVVEQFANRVAEDYESSAKLDHAAAEGTEVSGVFVDHANKRIVVHYGKSMLLTARNAKIMENLHGKNQAFKLASDDEHEDNRDIAMEQKQYKAGQGTQAKNKWEAGVIDEKPQAVLVLKGKANTAANRMTVDVPTNWIEGSREGGMISYVKAQAKENEDYDIFQVITVKPEDIKGKIIVTKAPDGVTGVRYIDEHGKFVNKEDVEDSDDEMDMSEKKRDLPILFARKVTFSNSTTNSTSNSTLYSTKNINEAADRLLLVHDHAVAEIWPIILEMTKGKKSVWWWELAMNVYQITRPPVVSYGPFRGGMHSIDSLEDKDVKDGITKDIKGWKYPLDQALINLYQRYYKRAEKILNEKGLLKELDILQKYIALIPDSKVPAKLKITDYKNMSWEYTYLLNGRTKNFAWPSQEE